MDLSNLDKVVNLVLELIKRDYNSLHEIPPHSRWRHFEASSKPNTKIDRISRLLDLWTIQNVDKLEKVKRLLDLFVISVLLDAGAGDQWKYSPRDEPDSVYNRSEGLGIASFDLFNSGVLSSVKSQPYQADSQGLKSLNTDDLGKMFQVSDDNPLVGLQGRCSLLTRLGNVLQENPQFFKSKDCSFRPGNLLEYLLNHQSTKRENNKYKVEIDTLWDVVIRGFSGVWPPTRTVLNGTSLGDVWPCKALELISNETNPFADYPGSENLICFHKLSQWLTYSLMEPLMLADIEFVGVEKMTGLAEYRNGGLFIDMGVIQLKPAIASQFPSDQVPKFQVYDDIVVEWRGLTVALLDIVAERIREKLGLNSKELPLAKVLEAGTWKAGREIAAKLRPKTKGPPIQVISDGTVF